MDIEFPMNEKGYPQSNIVIINNKSYPIEIQKISKLKRSADTQRKVKSPVPAPKS